MSLKEEIKSCSKIGELKSLVKGLRIPNLGSYRLANLGELKKQAYARLKGAKGGDSLGGYSLGGYSLGGAPEKKESKLKSLIKKIGKAAAVALVASVGLAAAYKLANREPVVINNVGEAYRMNGFDVADDGDRIPLEMFGRGAVGGRKKKKKPSESASRPKTPRRVPKKVSGKFTKEKLAKLIALVGAGAAIAYAVKEVGISVALLWEWSQYLPSLSEFLHKHTNNLLTTINSVWRRIKGPEKESLDAQISEFQGSGVKHTARYAKIRKLVPARYAVALARKKIRVK